MNRFVFVISHLGADYSNLTDVLNNHPQIQIYDTNSVYNSPISLEPILSLEHKLSNSSAIYGDCILKNINLQSKDLYSICKFIYLIDSPKLSLNKIMTSENIDHIHAMRYYTYRLRRIYEIAKTASGVLVNTEKFGDSLSEISQYLDLFEECKGEFNSNLVENIVPFETIQYCEERYEYYLYKIRSAIR